MVACCGSVAVGLGGDAERHLGVRDLHRAAAAVSHLDHALQLLPGLLGPPVPVSRPARVMWAAAVSLEYSFSPDRADSASASSENCARRVVVTLQVVDETEQC